MLINKARLKLRADLESPAEQRRFGTGWISGVAALFAAVAGLCFVLCLRYPAVLTVPQIRSYYNLPAFRLGLHLLLIAGFALAIISLVLRSNRILGFTDMALHGYILLVYIHSALVHANVKWEFNRIERFLVTPRFHHWHHGIEKEAIDVNFAIHSPLLDRVFGTYYLPKGQWPAGYGIAGHPVPRSYIRQLLYPFFRQRVASGEVAVSADK